MFVERMVDCMRSERVEESWEGRSGYGEFIVWLDLLIFKNGYFNDFWYEVLF